MLLNYLLPTRLYYHTIRDRRRIGVHLLQEPSARSAETRAKCDSQPNQ